MKCTPAMAKRRLRFLAAVVAAMLALTSFGLTRTAYAAPAHLQKLAGDLPAVMQKAGEGSPVPVIIRFAESLDSLDWGALEQKAGAKIAAHHRFAAIDGVAARLPAPALRALAALPQVAMIEHDSPVKAHLVKATNWYGTRQARADFGLDGDGITIAVVDTGIDGSHVDLAGKIVGWQDFVGGRTTPYDDNGHGTHVAGIAAGSGSGNASYTGVAPGARLVGLKALDSRGSGSASSVIAAVQWAIDHRAEYHIQVINLSLGSSYSSDGRDSLSAIVNNAAANGILPVVSAGNSGPRAYTIGSPAAAQSALTVGSMADPGNGGFYLVAHSSRGPTADGRVKPDIVAPGFLITSARANSGSGYVTMNGTSMAAPFAAGVAALMLQANPGLSAGEVKSLIMATAHDWGPEGADSDYGAGRLDGYAAIATAAGSSNTGGAQPLPVHLAFSGQLSGAGDTFTYDLNMTDRTFPIAATLIMPSWSGAGTPDFAMQLYDPAGELLTSTAHDARQDQLTKLPATTGTFRLVVVSKSGSGSYLLDLSAGADGAAEPPPPADEPPPPPPDETPPPSSWTSDDLEGRTWSVSGSGSFQKDYSFNAPSFEPVSGAVTIRVTTFKADGSNALDKVPPSLEVWAVQNGAESLVGTISPTGTGTYQLSIGDSAAVAAWSGSSSLRVRVVSMDKKTGKLSDKVAIDTVVVQLQY